MIQQCLSWAYTPRTPGLEGVRRAQWSLQHCLQQSRTETASVSAEECTEKRGVWRVESHSDITKNEMLPWWLRQERICLQCWRPGFHAWVGKIPWRRERQLTPVFCPGEFRGLHSPWGRKESDTAERRSLHFHWCCLSNVSEPGD